MPSPIPPIDAVAEVHEPQLVGRDAERPDREAARPAHGRREHRLARPHALDPRAQHGRGQAEHHDGDAEDGADRREARVEVLDERVLEHAEARRPRRSRDGPRGRPAGSANGCSHATRPSAHDPRTTGSCLSSPPERTLQHGLPRPMLSQYPNGARGDTSRGPPALSAQQRRTDPDRRAGSRKSGHRLSPMFRQPLTPLHSTRSASPCRSTGRPVGRYLDQCSPGSAPRCPRSARAAHRGDGNAHRTHGRRLPG